MSQAQDALDEVRHQRGLMAERNPRGWSRYQQRLKEQEKWLLQFVGPQETPKPRRFPAGSIPFDLPERRKLELREILDRDKAGIRRP